MAMGVLEHLETRVTALENSRAEHDNVHARIDQKLDQISRDLAAVKANTADLGEMRARVALIPELQAGQIEMREMLAKLLARDERRRDT
jgi:hypothetical protein